MSVIALPEIFQAAFEDFIIPSYETAPFSTIQNRAKVVRSLKAIAGVERVHVKGINLLPNEFGPNGEKVFEPSDKDSRVRLVGVWSQFSNSSGSGHQSLISDITSFIEISFYGTGLNWIGFATVGALDYRASIDGGVEGSNFLPSQSTILNTRNYSPNIITPIVSGLTLGLHTIKIRKNDTVSGAVFYGFEILNQRTDLAVYSGTGVSNGSSQGLSALATSAFNAGVLGTRGARVVKYIQGGIVSQAVQEVDATSKYLTLADHTNEEVIRRINFREFGANRADDFSTLALVASSRAFTLDDGTTTLVASSTTAGSYGSTEYFAVTILNSFWTLTFVGTGLDLVESYVTPTIVIDSATFFVDGVSIGSVTSGTTGVRKICSGLPYGTHTVKMVRNVVSTTSQSTVDFIIYRPKTPSIPAGALKVAAYNVMASYVANTVSGVDTIATGVLRKLCSREFTYVGTYTASGAVSDIGGIQITSSTVGNYDEYTFFGTGVEVRVSGTSGGATTNTVSIDGSSNFSGNTTSFYGAGVSFVAATGVLSMAISAAAGGVSINGLALGKHTIRITKTTGAFSFYNTALDIITPIHSQEPTFKVGSTSLKSVTKYSPEKSVANAGPDLSKAKAWCVYDGVNQKILASFGISAVLRSGVGQYYFYVEKPFKTSNWVTHSNSNTFARQTLGPVDGGQYKSSVVQFIQLFTQPGAATDGTIYMTCFGELIDE